VIPTLFGLGIYLAFWPRPRRLEGAAVSWAVGWAAVNLLSFTANQFLSIPLDATFYLAVSAALGLLGGGLVVLRRERVRPLLHGPFLPGDLKRGYGLFILVLLCGFLLFVLYKALIIFPVHADELIYHMELPKLAFQTGFLPVQPGIDLFDSATAYPDLLVTQQLWVYLGAGAFDPALVRVIMPTYTSLLVLLVFFDARQRFGIVSAGLAAAALLSVYSFTSLAVLLMDEIPVAFFGYLALRSAFDALDREGPWFAAGLFAGFAALVKYDGLAALLALGIALFVVSRWRAPQRTAPPTRTGWVASARRMLGFFLFAVPPTLPILVRNTVSLGNPVYPYFFGGLDAQWSPALLAQVDIPLVFGQILSSEAVSLLATVLIAAVLLGFLRLRDWTRAERLAMILVLFYLPPYLAYPLLGSQIRYLAPILPGLALFAGRQLDWWLRESSRPKRKAGMLLFLGLAILAEAIAAGAPFYAPYFQQIAAVTAWVFAVSVALILLILTTAWLVRGGGAPRALACGLVLVLLVPGIVAVADEQWDPNPFGGGPNLLPMTQDAYVTMKLGPDWRMWSWMNANLPADATVLSFDPRAFYIDARVVSAMSPQMLPTYHMTLAEAAGYLKTSGVSYVLVTAFGNSLFLNYLYVDSSPIFQNLSNPTYFEALHQEGSDLLYRVTGGA